MKPTNLLPLQAKQSLQANPIRYVSPPPLAADSVRFIVGARGSGKSTLAKHFLAAERRVIVWDPKREYAAELRCMRLDAPRALFEAVRSGVERICYEPRKMSDFDAWSACSMLFRDGVAVADELAAVTHAAKADGWWGRLLREGRHERMRVIGISQRAAEIDKTIMGNATHHYAFKMPRFDDRRAMAREMGIDQSLLDNLQPLEYIGTDDNGGHFHGRILFN